MSVTPVSLEGIKRMQAAIFGFSQELPGVRPHYLSALSLPKGELWRA